MTDLKGLLKRLDELREELGDEKGERVSVLGSCVWACA
jgi:hypothetical protein